jgi:hypothetical protein
MILENVMVFEEKFRQKTESRFVSIFSWLYLAPFLVKLKTSAAAKYSITAAKYGQGHQHC